MIFSYSYLVVPIVCSWLLWIHIEGCQNQFPCILNNTNGNITSPGYPASYPDHTNKSWLVIVPHGFTVKLTFESFSLEHIVDCKYDHVSIYDGRSTTGSPLIGRYCGYDKPRDQYSTDRHILVVFISDSLHSGTGFNIFYEALRRVDICSSNQTYSENQNIILKNSTGTLQTDFNNSTIPIECTWQIIAPLGHGIRVTFTSLRFLLNSSCSQNSIHLYTGRYTHEANNLIQKLCSVNVNVSNQIVKYNPERTVIVQLNASLLSPWDEGSFLASYEFVKKDLQKCSVLNTVNENANIQLSTISNSNFTAGSTWPNMQCAWRISAPKKQQIKLTFTDFKLHNDCQKAYIQIFDGATSKRGKFCGPDKPWAIFSTSGFLLVKLFVSGISKMLRFTGVYEAVTSAINRCSSINTKEMNTNIRLNARKGLIMTANFPSPYPPDFNCTWILTVQKNYRIKLHFKSFEFEGHNCKYDYVEVRDGNASTSPSKVGKLCGSALKPSDVYSSSNQMWVSFKSDPNEQESGFLATYSTVRPEPTQCSLVNTDAENNNIQIHETSGFLTSPNYPQPSPSIACTWYIKVPSSSRILVRFYDVSLASWCSDVYFALHDGNCTCSESLGNFCVDDGVPASVITTGNALTVMFKTSTGYYRGFNLSFHVPKTGPGICSVANSYFVNNNLYLNKTSGQVTSPDYPYPFVPGTECTWYARAPRGYHVFLNIKTISLPHPCGTNYLEIRDGLSLTSEVVGKLCENTTKTYYSSEQNLVLRFKSSKTIDHSFPGKFAANYRMIKAGKCSKEFDDSWNLDLKIDNSLYGIITSPEYPENYPANTRCIWKITVPLAYHIRLTITTLSFGVSCQDGMLNVRDGSTKTSPNIATFCGEAPKTKLITTGRSMFVQFQSGNSSGRGFEAFFAAITEESETQSTFQKVIIIVFVILAGFVLLTFSSMFIYWLLRKRCHPPRRRPSPPEHHDLTALPSLSPLTLDDIPDCLIAEDRPPSYDDATATEDNGTELPAEGRDEQQATQQQPAEPTEEVERGLDNPGFHDGSPPSYDSLFRDGG